MGNLCEHVFKVMKVCRDKGFAVDSSVSMNRFRRALIEALHFPPHVALARDHAVLLMLDIQKQLKSLDTLQKR